MHSGYALDVSEIINKFRGPLGGPNWDQTSTPPTPVSEVSQPQPSAANLVDDYSNLHKTTSIPSAKRTRAAFIHVDHDTPPFALHDDGTGHNSIFTTAAFELPNDITTSSSILSSDSSTSTTSFGSDSGPFSKGAPNPYSDSSSPEAPLDSSLPSVGKSLGTFICYPPLPHTLSANAHCLLKTTFIFVGLPEVE